MRCCVKACYDARPTPCDALGQMGAFAFCSGGSAWLHLALSRERNAPCQPSPPRGLRDLLPRRTLRSSREGRPQGRVTCDRCEAGRTRTPGSSVSCGRWRCSVHPCTSSSSTQRPCCRFHSLLRRNCSRAAPPSVPEEARARRLRRKHRGGHHGLRSLLRFALSLLALGPLCGLFTERNRRQREKNVRESRRWAWTLVSLSARGGVWLNFRTLSSATRTFPSAGVGGLLPAAPAAAAAPAAVAASMSAADRRGSVPAGTEGGLLEGSPPPDCSIRAAWDMRETLVRGPVSTSTRIPFLQ